MPMHDCPTGCGTRIATDLIMCRNDWAAVPLNMKGDLHRFFKKGEGADTPAYKSRLESAVRIVRKAQKGARK